MGVGSIIKLRLIYQVFKKLEIIMRWGWDDCKTPKIEILNDMIEERGCPWCNLEMVGAVMLMLASTVIKWLGNILAVYIGCKAVIPFVFSEAVYSLMGLMMRVNSGRILEYLLNVDRCDEYIGDDSVLQCGGGDDMNRRDVRASTWLKLNSDSGRLYKVKFRAKMVVNISVFASLG